MPYQDKVHVIVLGLSGRFGQQALLSGIVGCSSVTWSYYCAIRKVHNRALFGMHMQASHPSSGVCYYCQPVAVALLMTNVHDCLCMCWICCVYMYNQPAALCSQSSWLHHHWTLPQGGRELLSCPLFQIERTLIGLETRLRLTETKTITYSDWDGGLDSWLCASHPIVAIVHCYCWNQGVSILELDSILYLSA